jgi:DNA-directed RNA polymerase specialized sigma24 family protein
MNERPEYSNFNRNEASSLDERFAGGFSTERAIYKFVADYKIELNATELRMLVTQLATSLELYSGEALALGRVRQELYSIYDEKVNNGKATSFLSKDYNSHVRNHNEEVTKQIDSSFKDAYAADQSGQPSKAVAILQTAGIHSSVLFSDRITQLVRAGVSGASGRLQSIHEYRETLFFSVVPMVSRVARNHSRDLGGTTFKFADMLQEAFAAALKVVNDYEPIDEGKTFTTFVYASVSGILLKKKYELTRNVAVPRVVLDRFSYIHRAAKEMGMSKEVKADYSEINENELEDMVNRANAALPEGKKLFTLAEVADLYRAVQHEVSLETPVANPDGSSDEDITTLGSQIEDPMDIEQALDMKYAGRRLMALMKPFLNNDEYLLMELRWGMGEVQSYQSTAAQFAEATGRPMNKTSAANIEQRAFKRLRKATEGDHKLHEKFMQIWESIEMLEVM